MAANDGMVVDNQSVVDDVYSSNIVLHLTPTFSARE